VISILFEYAYSLFIFVHQQLDGFRKVNSIDHGSLKSEKDDMEFHHPYFMKGKEQFLEFIKRKVRSRFILFLNNKVKVTRQRRNLCRYFFSMKII
jgi:hypothetical protein